MKKIEAILRSERFDIVKDALTEKGYGGMSVAEIKGHGNQKGVSEVWKGKRINIILGYTEDRLYHLYNFAIYTSLHRLLLYNSPALVESSHN